MNLTKKIFKIILVIIAVIACILILFSRPIAKDAVRSDNVALFETLRKAHLVNPGAVWMKGRFLDVSARESYLSLAIESESKKVFEKLLSLGVVSEKESNSEALFRATYSKDLYWIEEITKAGVSLKEEWGGYPIFFRTVDNIDMLQYYLDHGADINQLSYMGTSIALEAASENKFDVVSYLLDQGASPWVAETYGYTIGHYAETAPARGQMVEDGQGNSESKSWDKNSQLEKDRQKVLTQLRTLGFPSPAPEPEEVVKLVEAGKWPPKQ